jgi:transposase
MTKNIKHDRKEPYIYFISNIENAKKVLKHYLKRWKIECCFRHLKSNGFNMEAMNLKTDNKIELMMGLVVTAYAIAVREGMLSFMLLFSY